MSGLIAAERFSAANFNEQKTTENDISKEEEVQ
jgi:hypothetical protein